MGSALTRKTKSARSGAALTREDQRAERTLGALSSLVLLLILGMIVFVFKEAWPSFAANGIGWFGAEGSLDQQIGESLDDRTQTSFGAWPLIWSTFLISFFAIGIGTVIALLSAIFIVEFAPKPIQRVLEPVVRLLAAVPSVIYGLIGILVLVPFFLKTFVTEEARDSVRFVIQLNGESLAVAIVILTVMITPIMIAIIVDALRSVPSAWTQGAAALGVNRWRSMWTVSVRAARPAVIAAGVLASARALGEAIMLYMVSGGDAHAPNPFDGLVFFAEPSRPLAATVVANAESLSIEPLRQNIFAIAAVLLVSAGLLSFSGWFARRSLSKYTLAPR